MTTMLLTSSERFWKHECFLWGFVRIPLSFLAAGRTDKTNTRESLTLTAKFVHLTLDFAGSGVPSYSCRTRDEILTYVSCIPHKIGTCQKISGHARSGCRPSVISDVSWCSYVYVWRVVIKVFRFVYHYKMSFLRWSSSTVRTVHSTYGYGSSTHNDMEMQISSTVLYASTT